MGGLFSSKKLQPFERREYPVYSTYPARPTESGVSSSINYSSSARPTTSTGYDNSSTVPTYSTGYNSAARPTYSTDYNSSARPTTSTGYNNSFAIPTYSTGYNSTSRPTASTRTSDNNNYYETQRLATHLSNFQSIYIQERKISPPERSQININLFGLYQEPFFILTPNLTTYNIVDDYDSESQEVRRLITNKRNFKVDVIMKIENPLLSKAYNLKKEQKQKDFPYLEERLLFHGTKRSNVDAICNMNFDWRKCETHLYGAGVSFSPNCNYAANYSDEGLENRVMILAKVLIGTSCFGNKEMKLPVEGCDTSQKGHDGIVIVKYDDHEFLPLYKIKYHLIYENKGKLKNQNRNRRQSLPFSHVENYYDDPFHLSY